MHYLRKAHLQVLLPLVGCCPEIWHARTHRLTATDATRIAACALLQQQRQLIRRGSTAAARGAKWGREQRGLYE
jgi:hypothetical protein